MTAARSSWRQVHVKRGRLCDRHSLLQGRNQHGHAHGSLWSSNGTLLARATFTGESASGWQQVTFTNPVAVTPGSTYIASYHAPNGHYALNLNYFTSAHSNGPLQALADSQSSNGVYRYSATQASPTKPGKPATTGSTSSSPPTHPQTPPHPRSPTSPPPPQPPASPPPPPPPPPSTKPSTPTITNTSFQLRDGTGALVAATVNWDTLTRRATLTPTAPLAPNTTYTATAKTSITDPAGNHLASHHTWSFTTGGQASDFSLWPGTTQPALAASGDSSAVEVGVKFTSSVAGYVTGIRFYKGATNTGTHTGSLWSSNGTLLARATFTGESASGWQQVNFDQPGRSHPRQHLHRLLPRPQRPLRAQPQRLHQRPQQRAAPGARRQPKQQRRLPLQRHPRLPRPNLASQQLLGPPRLHHQRTPRHHPTHDHRRHPRRRNHRRPHHHHRHRHLQRSPRPNHDHQHQLPTPGRHRRARRSHRQLGHTHTTRNPHPHRPTRQQHHLHRHRQTAPASPTPPATTSPTTTPGASPPGPAVHHVLDERDPCDAHRAGRLSRVRM